MEISMNEKKEEILSYIEEIKEEFIKVSQEIWENPELGLEEFYASGLISNLLEKYGFSVERGIADMPTAFVATAGEGAPVIGVSVEYDCLPGLSQKKETPYPSPVKEGAPGQGCGHNILGVSAALAAAALKKTMEENGIKGTLKVFGTPAEEICVGKPFLARDGWFDDLDYVLDWHPWWENAADADYCNAYFNVRYHFKGKNAHGNSPWCGRSALDGAIWTGHAVEVLREHIRPEEAASANTINFTFSDVGPEIPNVVPERSTLWCIGRFRTGEEMKGVMARIDKCAEAGALATGTTVEKEFVSASREKIPNRTLTEVLYKNMCELGELPYTEEEQAFVKEIQKNDGTERNGLPTNMREVRECGVGVTDSAEYSWKAPTANFKLAVAPGGGWHNWRVCTCVGGSIGMKAMVHAAKILALSNLDVLDSPDLITKAKEELKERLDGKTYVELVPKDVKPPVLINHETMEKYKN